MTHARRTHCNVLASQLGASRHCKMPGCRPTTYQGLCLVSLGHAKRLRSLHWSFHAIIMTPWVERSSWEFFLARVGPGFEMPLTSSRRRDGGGVRAHVGLPLRAIAYSPRRTEPMPPQEDARRGEQIPCHFASEGWDALTPRFREPQVPPNCPLAVSIVRCFSASHWQNVFVTFDTCTIRGSRAARPTPALSWGSGAINHRPWTMLGEPTPRPSAGHPCPSPPSLP